MAQVTVSDVLVAVARRFNTTPEFLRGPRQHRTLAHARQIAYLVAVDVCPHLSLNQISKQVGDRDHTTIMWGLKRVRARVAADPELERAVNEIERELRGGLIPQSQVIHPTEPRVDVMRAG